MERTTYLVTYDICDPKRLRAVYVTCRSYGDHLQYSVFRCDLSPLQKARLIAELDDILNKHEDQVLIVALGSAGTEVDRRFESVGRPYARKTSGPTIV